MRKRIEVNRLAVDARAADMRDKFVYPGHGALIRLAIAKVKRLRRRETLSDVERHAVAITLELLEEELCERT